MLLEALVVGLCTSGSSGCSEASSAYYKQSKELQQITERLEAYGKDIILNKEWLIYIATPTYALMTNQKANFTIYKGLILGIGVRDSSVSLTWRY